MKILGIDPSINNSGWAIIEKSEGTEFYKYINGGVVICDNKLSIPEKLSKIYKFFENIINGHNIKCISMEKSFINTNAVSSMKLAYVRGSLISLIGHYPKIIFNEYSPNHVKKSIVGQGHASKEQVAYLLPFLIESIPQESMRWDHTDAIAIAYSCAKNLQLCKIISRLSD